MMNGSSGCRQTCLFVKDQEKTSKPKPQRIQHELQTSGKKNSKERFAQAHKNLQHFSIC